MPGVPAAWLQAARTATHTESTLYLRRTCCGRRMTQMGHEDQFPLCRLNARCVIRKETSAGTYGNGRDAPKAVINTGVCEPRGSTISRSIRSPPLCQIAWILDIGLYVHVCHVQLPG